MKKQKANILIVDDDSHILFSLQTLLERYFTQIYVEKSPKQIPSLMSVHELDAIILDMNYNIGETSGSEGIGWINKILEIDPHISVIPITAYGGVNMAVEALKSGAVDFIVKPWQNEKIISTITAACNFSKTKRNVTVLKEEKALLNKTENFSIQEFIGVSEAMKSVQDKIEKLAETEASVLILGENGTGKGIAARAIHELSSRKNENFIHTDLGSLSENLFESELFGYVKGAFTDARENRLGRFEAANKGSLFLDEIANIPTGLQTKLLSVLENRQIFRLGSNKAIDIDIRLISATNSNIYKNVSNGEFRNDLLYRINTIEILLPPLRHRMEDIPVIANYYIEKYARKYHKNINPLAEKLSKLLSGYEWPGNVRELQHSIERAVILCDSSNLTDKDFQLRNSFSEGEQLKFENYNLNNIEKYAIQNCLIKHKGHITNAAIELGITRGALYRRLEKYEINQF